MLNPARTLAVVCGASEWPNLPNLVPAEAFQNSASAIRKYLTGAPGLQLPKSNLLWLFNLPNVVSQYDRINNFIQSRLTAFGSPTGRDVAILFVYVGHGSFHGAPRQYCLLLRDTRAPYEIATSFNVSLLAHMFKLRAAESSRVLILDCCFAGEAARLYQGTLDQAVSVKAHELMEEGGPDRGVVLLCASSASESARLESRTSYTLFGQSLVHTLVSGDPDNAGALSVHQVCKLVRQHLNDSGLEDPPLPEVHVPNQKGGDLAAVPLFPNFAAPSRAGKAGALAEQSAADLSAHIRLICVGDDSHALSPVAGTMALEASMSAQGRPHLMSARYVAEKVYELRPTRNGALLEDVCKVLQESGAALEASWPFIPSQYDIPAGKQMRDLDAEAKNYRARIVELLSFAELLESLTKGRPVLAGAPWFNEWFDHFHTPEHPKTDGHLTLPADPKRIIGGQPIVITAWNPGEERIRFANTFGEYWGDEGFGSFNKKDARTLLDRGSMWSVEAVDRSAPFRW